MKKLSDMREQNMSQDLVIKEVNQQLSDKRSLFASESQRMHQQTQQMQAEIQRLHADLHRAQNQLAGHQQSSEQRLTSLTTQLNLARQEQVGGGYCCFNVGIFGGWVVWNRVQSLGGSVQSFSGWYGTVSSHLVGGMEWCPVI